METEQKIEVGKNQRNKKTFLSLKKSICFHIERISEMSNMAEKRLALIWALGKCYNPKNIETHLQFFFFMGIKE